MEADAFTPRRAALVRQLADLGVARSPAVLRALAAVQRERFVPPELKSDAYRDEPLAIGAGQTISAPHMVSLMAEALAPQPGDRVLEVGGGSGYHAAVYAEMVGSLGEVYAIERVAELAIKAREALVAAGYDTRVRMIVGDGSQGYPQAQPFDRISVACAAPAVPVPLVDQLKPGGRLVLPVGSLDWQDLIRLEKREDASVTVENLGACRFVPLLGAHGF